MRVIFGMIIGAMLTVAAAFFHDSLVTSSVATGASASDEQAFVNWNVVNSNLRVLEADLRVIKTRARESWTKLTDRI